MRWMARWLLSVTLAIAAMSASATAALPEEWKYLDAPLTTQEKNNWCWAGSGVCVLNYYGIYDADQCAFVSKVKTGGTDPEICDDVQASDAEIRYGLAYFGVSSSAYSGALSWSATNIELDNERPIHAHIRWLDSRNQDVGGHSVVIDGYYYYPDLDSKEIRYMDPWDGVYKTRSYSGFVRTDYQQYWKSGLWYLTN